MSWRHWGGLAFRSRRTDVAARAALPLCTHQPPTRLVACGAFARCPTRLWEGVNDVFDHLPLVAFVAAAGRRVMLVHGGIGNVEVLSEALASVPRPLRDASQSPVANELMWSDPSHRPGCAPAGLRRRVATSSVPRQTTDAGSGAGMARRGKGGDDRLTPNERRGVATLFGPDVVARFCDRNNIQTIVRAHEVVPDGFAWHTDDHQLLTLFSATNYCGVSGNSGAAAVLAIDGSFTLHSLRPRMRVWDQSPRSPPPSP